MTLDEEIENLRTKLAELNAEINRKTIENDLIKGVGKLIALHSGTVISARSAALMSTCAQLKALLSFDDKK